MPTVLLNIEPTDDADYVRVLPDEVAAGADAARLLVDSGHRRIHLIGVGDGPQRTRSASPPPSASRRPRGLRRGRAADRVGSSHGAVAPPEGFRLVSEVLDSGAEVDALLCFNDRLAMGAYQALQERGVRVPDDVSVLSFDDTSFARWLRPGLTTFAFPQRALGRAAADELIDLIERGAREDGSSPPVARLVPLPLRMRASVADRT
jgi:LacI family transcriptional regulator